MLEVQRFAFARGVSERVLHECEVFGMDSPQHLVQGRLGPSIEPQDLIGLVRPEYLAAGHVPAEAAGKAESLCLGQESLAALEFVVCFFAFGDVAIDEIGCSRSVLQPYA